MKLKSESEELLSEARERYEILSSSSESDGLVVIGHLKLAATSEPGSIFIESGNHFLFDIIDFVSCRLCVIRSAIVVIAGELRGKGLGKILMERSEAWAKAYSDPPPKSSIYMPI